MFTDKGELDLGSVPTPTLAIFESSAYLCDVPEVIAKVAECLVSVWNK